jgi:hypothetical protein
MTPKTDSGSLVPDATPSSQGGSKRQFDTFETKFFQQGDDESAGLGIEVERFDDLDESSLRKKLMPSRQFMMGVAVGSTCIAIIGCLALWRSSAAKSHAATAVAAATPTQAEPTAVVNPTPVAAPAQADPVAAPSPAQAEPIAANPSAAAAPAIAANPSAAAAPAQAEPLAAPTPPSPVPAVAQAASAPSPAVAAAPSPAAAPTPAAAVAGQAEPAAAGQPSPAAVAPGEAKPVAAGQDQDNDNDKEEAKPAAPSGATAGAADAQSRCKKAMSDKRSKEILAACPEAFAADSSAADIAVVLAKIEFDRGRGAQASAWGRKALAADPNAADAYVFIGGAEQSAGHRKAAKEAYKRYLQLAPGGRYASDLRAIVGSL